MPFSMKFSKEDVTAGQQPVDPGIYTVAFVKFAPKMSKNGESLNFNAHNKIVGGGDPKFHGRFIFASLNTSIPSFIQDFVHAYGLTMEEDGDSLAIPGHMDQPNLDDPSTWKYQGPLIGQTAEFELTVSPHYQDPNRTQQDIVRFICKVSGCNVKHASDMRKKG